MLDISVMDIILFVICTVCIFLTMNCIHKRDKERRSREADHPYGDQHASLDTLMKE